MFEGPDIAREVRGAGKPLISIVVPVLNEEDTVRPFVAAVDCAIAESWPGRGQAPRLEFVFVDDGSTDGTASALREICRTDARVRVVVLSRNFGKEAALSAGLKAAGGDAVIPMDVDLQDPPQLIRPMVEKWQAGARVVNARRVDRSEDTLFKRASSSVFYRAINYLAEQPIADNVGDFRLLDRVAVTVLNEMTERSRFNKGLFSWIGFKTETIEYSRPTREIGTTKWKVGKLVRLAIDGIVSSTTLPLRVWTTIGAVIASLAFCYAAYLVFDTLVNGVDTPGYASLMVAVLFLGGLNLFSLGLMGEYIGRIAIQVRGRPLYIVSSTDGF